MGTERTVSSPTAASQSAVGRALPPGGLRVVTEFLPAVRSVALGIWVGVGSRDEDTAHAGATHYLEHLLFKGTRKRTALQIAADMDEVGGELNAFTAKEYTCYYARVLDEDVALAVDVIVDMVTSSLLASVDVDSERGVILEEIAMHDDDPADVVHDTFAATVWPDTPLGRPVLGTTETIGAMSRASVAGYYRRRYRPDTLVVTAAGNLDHARVVRLVKAALDEAAFAGGEVPHVPARTGGRGPAFQSGHTVVHRPTEQANLVIGVPAFSRTDDRRFALGVLNGVLGGGMSSRLFQEVREKRGLAYSVYSFTSHYADTGVFGVYAGAHPARSREVLEICREELQRAARDGVGDDELARGKGQLRGGLVLGLEDTGSRMSRLGKSELVYGELLTVGEILDRIDAVTLDDVCEVAEQLLEAPLALAAIGPYDSDDELKAAVS